MNRDIVERLNTASVFLGDLNTQTLLVEKLMQLCTDAAEEIRALRADVQRLDAAFEFVSNPVLPGESKIEPPGFTEVPPVKKSRGKKGK
jgi:hypothetical protein